MNWNLWIEDATGARPVFVWGVSLETAERLIMEYLSEHSLTFANSPHDRHNAPRLMLWQAT